MFIDSHCHLDRLDLTPYGGELSGALQAAAEAKVSHMLCIGVDLNNSPTVVNIAEEHANVFSAVGVHPLDCHEMVPDIDTVKALAAHPKVVALGETGLDYHYANSEGVLAVQRQSFINHLQLGSELNLPVVVHTREARDDTVVFLQQYAGEARGVIHCFTESLEMAKQVLDLGFMISISGIVTFNNASALRDVVRYVPIESLLIETDSPYLAPVPHRGKTNEPKYVAEVGAYVASLKGVSVETLGQQTSDNFFRMFARAQR